MFQRTELPDNIHELKEIINNLQSQYETNIQEKEKELKEERFKYLVLEERFQILQRRFSAEKAKRFQRQTVTSLICLMKQKMSVMIMRKEYKKHLRQFL